MATKREVKSRGINNLKEVSDNESSATMTTTKTLFQSAAGLLLAVGAGMSTACVSTITKLVKNDLTFWEVVFYRGVMNSVLVYSYLVVSGRGNLLKGVEGGTLATVFLRGWMFIGGVVVSFAVNQHIPLGDASALMGTSTVMTGFLGIFLLNEKWHLPEMLISLLCWAGVLLVSRPASLFAATEGAASTDDGTSVYYALALVAALLTSLSFLFVRKIGRSIDVARLVLFSELMSVAFCFCVLQTMQGGVKLPPPNTWKYLPWLSVGSIMVQVLMSLALRIEKASTAVVLRTAGLVIMSFIMQTVIFQTVPEGTSVAGAGLILASTALLSLRKMKQDKVKQN